MGKDPPRAILRATDIVVLIRNLKALILEAEASVVIPNTGLAWDFIGGSLRYATAPRLLPKDSQPVASAASKS